MITRKRKAILMKAVSELKRADYTSEPELGVMYDRLADGRKQFAEVFEISMLSCRLALSI